MDAPDVTREQACETVVRALGERPVRAKLVPTGEDNLVFYVELPAGEVFTKIGPPGRTRVEARAYAAAAAAGFPVPEVLAEGSLGEWAFFVTRAAGGVQLPTLSEPQRLRAARALGEALRALHSLPANGFGGVSEGRLLDDGVWEAGSDGFGRIVRQAEWGLGYLVERGLITVEDGDAIRAALAAREVMVDGPSSVLHGDLASDAAYADPETGELTAVIDFGDVMCGPPAWEFVPVAVHDAQALRPMVAGYGIDVEQIRPVLAAGTFSRAAAGARWVHERGLDPDATWAAGVRRLAADPSLADRLEPVIPQV